jgi:uncharacterized MnhB-related membrane protein
MTYIVLILCVFLVGMALATILVKDLRSAIILLSALSLFASLAFLIVAAPDVAITEAAIGSALTTVIFVIALFRTRKSSEGDTSASVRRVDESARAVRSKESGNA